ncbi:MAG: cation diffusion facilitator family transporter [Rikenellaceae bacterium]|nr:cation diffusion facilitator family transporter [Rikenellaceae bacterium]
MNGSPSGRQGRRPHRHSHTHAHSAEKQGKKLLWVTVINVGILVLEILGGWLSNSLALLFDAVHKLEDSFSLVVAFLANRLGNKQADFRKTFGYKRVEILAALFNALLLVGICVFLVVEAYERFLNPEPIRGGLMLIVTLIGLIADWVCVLMLQRNKNKNINVKAAYLHLLGDTLSSVAVIAGGITILLWGIEWVDPVVTVLVCLYLIYHTWGVLKESVDILMQAAPSDLDPREIQQKLEAVPEVSDIHHIHIWRLTDRRLYFECHVNVSRNMDMIRMQAIRQKLETILRRDFHVDHTTLQFEYRCCQNQGLIVTPEEPRKPGN